MSDIDQKMIPIYANLIRAGLRGLDTVPEPLRAAVQEVLIASPGSEERSKE